MGSTLLVVRVLHVIFILTWFQFIFLLGYLSPPERPVSIIYPIALGAFAIASVNVCLRLRKTFIHQPSAAFQTQPENEALLNRWRAGNILSFAFAETTMLFGVLLKFLGENWKIVALFFAAGLALQLLWTPRKIEALPQRVR